MHPAEQLLCSGGTGSCAGSRGGIFHDACAAHAARTRAKPSLAELSHRIHSRYSGKSTVF
jgi:hypothetical protein